MSQYIEKYVEGFAKTFVNQIKTVKIGQYDENGTNIGFKTAYNLMQDWLRTTLTTYGNARYEEGAKEEATRRDGIEHAIEQSIIDQHVANERNRITQWAMEVLPFYPEAQKALIEFLADNK